MLDHPKWMFDLGPRLGCEVLNFLLFLLKRAALDQPGVGAALSCDLPNYITILMFLAPHKTGVARFGIDHVFLSMQRFCNLGDIGYGSTIVP